MTNLPKKTDKKYQNQNLKIIEREAESEAIFSSIGDGAIATDAYGHITRINSTALSILGFKREQMIGQWFPQVFVAVRPDNTPLPLMDRPIFKMFLTGKVISEKILYRGQKGLIIPVNATVSPIILRGRPIGAIELFRDITLETEVDKMKSEFISLASHQLRTPLSTIKTYSHMLIEGYVGNITYEQRQSLKIITRATNNMNELISTLLNIARIESGSLKISRKRTDIKSLLTNIVKQLGVQARHKSVKLNFNSPKKPIYISTDSLIVREIVTNLITNSIKYTPKDKQVVVSIRDLGSSVLLTVQDEGLGIPLESQNNIFTKFYRAHNVVQLETAGTGLGLYVAKELVTLLDGTIKFKSIENTGSTFYVTLPKKFTQKTEVIGTL